MPQLRNGNGAFNADFVKEENGSCFVFGPLVNTVRSKVTRTSVPY